MEPDVPELPDEPEVPEESDEPDVPEDELPLLPGIGDVVLLELPELPGMLEESELPLGLDVLEEPPEPEP